MIRQQPWPAGCLDRPWTRRGCRSARATPARPPAFPGASVARHTGHARGSRAPSPRRAPGIARPRRLVRDGFTRAPTTPGSWRDLPCSTRWLPMAFRSSRCSPLPHGLAGTAGKAPGPARHGLGMDWQPSGWRAWPRAQPRPAKRYCRCDDSPSAQPGPDGNDAGHRRAGRCAGDMQVRGSPAGDARHVRPPQ